VELEKLNRLPGFVVAGVVDPARADEAVMEPNGDCPEVVLAPPNRVGFCC
jgi:hypothetical protein